MNRIYVNVNGRAVCPDHIGHYGEVVLRKRPDAYVFQTPTDHWVRIDDAGIGCEGCEAFGPTI